MSVIDRVHVLVAPLCDEYDTELFDVEHNGGVLRITIEKDGGVDIDTLKGLTRAVSRALDEADPIAGRYTLEVSSPGLERTLRTSAHFRWAIGKEIKLKTRPGVEGERRVRGLLTEASEHDFTLVLEDSHGATRRLAYDDIERARTVFEWGPAPKPGKGPSKSPAADPSSPPTRKASS